MFSLRFTSTHVLLAAVCLLFIAGCHAQTPADTPLSSQQNRRVALLVRSQLNVPPDWEIATGPRSPSNVPGFDTLRIDFYPASDPSHKQPLDFLISKDSTTLARMTKYDLADVPGTNIPTQGRPIRGNKDAKIEIVNFDDLECPYCARMHAELFPQTLDHYKGLVKVVYKDDPLVEIHPWAMHAAVDANCLATQDAQAYWNYVDYVHTHGEDITGPDRDPAKSYAMLDKLAREEGTRAALNSHWNKPVLESCITQQDDSAVRVSMKEAEALKIDGTPALFVDGERISGAQPLPYLWAAIDRALRAQGVMLPPASTMPVPARPSSPGGTR